MAYLVPPNIRRTIEPTDAKILVMPQGNISSHTNKFRERERSFRNAFGKNEQLLLASTEKEAISTNNNSSSKLRLQQTVKINEGCRQVTVKWQQTLAVPSATIRSFHRNGQANDRAPSDDNGVVVDAGSVCHSVDGIWYSVFNKCAAIPGFSSLHPCLILTLAGDWNKKSFLNFLYANRFVFISAFFVNNVFFSVLLLFVFTKVGGGCEDV